MTHRIAFDEQCPSCGGTGLYVGRAERDGAAVVCHACSGTGCHRFVRDYTPFARRLDRPGVRRVYRCNPGIVIGAGDGLRLEDFGGIPKTDWDAGGGFPRGSEDRAHTCPKWWAQIAGERGPDWDACRDSLGRSFSFCPHFLEKSGCWARWDAEANGA